MAEFTAMSLNTLAAIMRFFGEPVTVRKKDGTEIAVPAVRDRGVEIVGEYGQRVDVRDRWSFSLADVAVEIGDTVILGGVEQTIDAIDTDDGQVRAVWMR